MRIIDSEPIIARLKDAIMIGKMREDYEAASELESVLDDVLRQPIIDLTEKNVDGVFLRGMTMPTNCEECRFNDTGFCFAHYDWIDHIDCPLEEVARNRRSEE